MPDAHNAEPEADRTPTPDDQIELIVRGGRLRLASARERADILDAVLRAIDQYETLIATIRSSASADAARQRVIELLDIDEVQARAVMDIQARWLTDPQHQRLVDEYDRAVATIAELEATLASPERVRELVGTERGRDLARYGES